jgi:hypothetical protein
MNQATMLTFLAAALCILSPVGMAQNTPEPCTCVPQGNSPFPLVGQSGTTSLTETVACTSGLGSCTLAGTFTWTHGGAANPICGPCCANSGPWAEGSSSTSSVATLASCNTINQAFWTDSQCDTAGSVTPTTVVAGCDPNCVMAWACVIKDCSGANLVCDNVIWSGSRSFVCQ